MDRQLADDLGFVNRLAGVAAIALACALWARGPILAALVLVLVVWPMSIVAPMRWRNEIDQQEYLSWALRFLPGLLGVFVAAFGDSRGPEFPTAALIVGFGCLHLVLVLALSPPVKLDFRRLSPWLAACVWGIAGTLADLPVALGWNALAFFLYGLVGAQVALTIRRPTALGSVVMPT
ncbi:MAG: hypothetical protein GY926_12965 [bacterium]|nr:hypothetical protein [bacterium]